MATRPPKPASIEAYIAGFPKDVRATLRAVRRAIRQAVPEAEESISYQMPYYKFHGRLLYFAAFPDHWSLFAVTPGVRRAFRKQLARYEDSGKGTIRFPLDKPVPVRLVAAIAKHRAKENLRRVRAR
jgi:uncharacterized protein YdhG (YjbR/CyaY superfamily)